MLRVIEVPCVRRFCSPIAALVSVAAVCLLFSASAFAAGAPTVGSETVASLGQVQLAGGEGSTAKIKAEVDPHGLETYVYVEYGLAHRDSVRVATYSQAIDIGAGEGAQDVGLSLEKMKAGTLYSYRVVAFNAQGTAEGQEKTFTTLPAPAAEGAAPGWQLTSTLYPTNVPQGGTGTIEIDLYNVGAADSSGTVTVTDTLPPGMTAVEAGGLEVQGGVTPEEEGWECTGTHVVTCTNIPSELPNLTPGGEQSKGESFFGFYELGIKVKIEPGASSGLNEVTASGGGALAPASTTDMLTVGSTPPPFGFANVDGWLSNRNGTIDTQAGSHPYEMTIDYHLNTVAPEGEPEPAGGQARNLTVNLPPGFVGDRLALPECTRQQFDGEKCSTATQVGLDTAGLPEEVHPFYYVFPVYNLVPPPGVAAEFGFTYEGIQVFLDSTVRSGGNYGITVHAINIPQRKIVNNSIVIWGDPGEAIHDPQRRGEGCGREGEEGAEFGCASHTALTPLVTLPTACEGPQTFTVAASSWEDASTTAQASFVSHDGQGTPTGFTGCDDLGFGPSISIAPDTSFADTPAGLTVDVKAPQAGLLNPEGLSTSNLKDTTVVLPQGVAINPGQAAGLAACQESEAHVGHENEEAPACPNASKVGEDEIETPLLPHALKGSVYVLQSNPPNLKLLLAASGEGVNLKLVGDVHLNETTGQLTTTFAETPELPFTNFKLAFSGGAQAALSTPPTCGTYTSNADFTPWTSPFVQDLSLENSFVISNGPNGGACAEPLPFSPVLTAGATTDQAGGYTDFSMLLQRGDAQQRIEKLQFKTPEGLLGMISKVPLCQEPQAAAGTCSAASQIGHTVVESGPGPYPLVVPQPGQPPAPIYLTGGYKGAPYGLSIVVPLVVGPFTLQTQVVRAKIEVDRRTAQLTITTDPLPSIIDGIPADLRTINAVIDREGFMFNPTGCEPQSFSGTATSTEGATVPISTPFQVGSCRALKFQPNFKVSTAGRTSKENGASLDARLVYPTGELGDNQATSQANIKMVKVELPKILPSRLTTLQKACTAAQFESDPSGCPAASIVGHATVVTPVLPVPLTGPAYFVSHGGEAFPSLIVVLQGYGVTVELVGTTFIDSKTGVTSSTFKQVPDVPIASFELVLPEGPYSALAANGNLCKAKSLAMPTEFIGQNGAEIKQSTKIAVTGCPKAKRATKRERAAKAKGKQGKGGAKTKRRAKGGKRKG